MRNSHQGDLKLSRKDKPFEKAEFLLVKLTTSMQDIDKSDLISRNRVVKPEQNCMKNHYTQKRH